MSEQIMETQEQERVLDTALAQWDYTKEQILQGEPLELPVEAKPKRKQSYVDAAFAQTVVNACVVDLKQAYEQENVLAEEVESLKQRVTELEQQAKQQAEEIEALRQGETKLSQAEKLLNDLEQRAGQLAEKIKADQAAMEQLNAKVLELSQYEEEALSLREEVPKLREDVQVVLDNLQEQMAKYGMDVSYEE